MKTKRLFLLTVILVATLLVCIPAIGFAAQTADAATPTAETPTVSIERFNLSFEDSIYVKYAVKLTGVESAASLGKENFRMLFWTAPQAEYTFANAESSSYNLGKQTIGGEDLYIFSYENLAAKQMTDNIYARAYAKVDGVEYYSDVEKYSVLQYAYNKLGYTGTATTDEELKTLLTEMLAYGAAAQKYFDYNTDRLADAQYYQVTVNGGTLPDGFESGLYLAGEQVLITAPETDANGAPFSYWENSAGEVASRWSSDYLIVGEANETYTPVYSNFVFYLEDDNTYTIAANSNATLPSTLVIPSTHNGLPVTGIKNYGFESCNSIASVTIPSSVTFIGEQAFCWCENLTSVTIPNSVTSIGGFAFFNCTSLTSVTIPDSVTSIDAVVFSGCENLVSIEVASGNPNYKAIDGNLYTKDGKTLLQYASGKSNTSFTVPSGVEIISESAFENARLEHVTIPDSVTVIDSFAFMDCDNLVSVTMGNGVTRIGDQAFAYCSSLTSIVIPDSVTSIEGGTFVQCTNLTSVSFGNGVESIGYQAFAFCESLTSVTLPDRLKTIGEGAFVWCSGLTSVTFGNGLTTIEEQAFFCCDALTSIVIPDSVTTIGNDAFSATVETVYYGGVSSYVWIYQLNNYPYNSNGNSGLAYSTVYYYSKIQPTTTGNYWHYVNGVPTAW